MSLYGGSLKTLLYYYPAAVSFILLVVMGADKAAARNKRRRVPERTLFSLALLGGSIGGIAGMLLFHHKTRKPAFYLGFPLIALAQLALGLWIGGVL